MKLLKGFIYEDEGMGTIEIAIIIAVLVAIAILFKDQIIQMWSNVSGKGTNAMKNLTGGEDPSPAQEEINKLWSESE